MSEYTPTTKEIQSVWGIAVHRDKREERFREFGRWLQQERAKAWAEGYNRALEEFRVIPHWKNTQTGEAGFDLGESDDTYARVLSVLSNNPYLDEEETANE